MNHPQLIATFGVSTAKYFCKDYRFSINYVNPLFFTEKKIIESSDAAASDSERFEDHGSETEKEETEEEKKKV